MSEEKVLTKEIAEQFLADAKSVELSLFTTIEDAAAENLSKYKGRLYLNGLSEISDSAADSLSKQGDLVLGDPVLSDTAREILSETVGSIRMKKKTITRVIAERFLLRWNKERLMEKLPRVYLDEFSLLNDDAAHKLSEAEVGLNLSGLIHLSDSSAEILSKHRGKSTLGGGLNLEGISELTETATDHLCKYKGYLKIGSNLQKINERLAARLINQKDMNVNGCIHDLHFPFLTELGETVAETLSKHQADVRLPYDLQSKLDAFKKG